MIRAALIGILALGGLAVAGCDDDDVVVERSYVGYPYGSSYYYGSPGYRNYYYYNDGPGYRHHYYRDDHRGYYRDGDRGRHYYRDGGRSYHGGHRK